MSPEIKHFPVMSEEVIKYVSKNKKGIYIDCTFGMGGHSRQLLSVLDKEARVISFDIDDEAVEIGRALEKEDSRFSIHKLNFRNLSNFCRENNISGVDGIIFDLGVSALQIKNPERGFTYMASGDADENYLDMRMDKSQELNAADILNFYKKDKLNFIFKRYGDIKKPQKLVNLIIQYRKQNDEIFTLQEFKELIKQAFPGESLTKMYKKCFQALRIEVNNELNVFDEGLSCLDEIMKPEGIACVITFHSLEEDIFKKWKDRYCDIIQIPDYCKNVNNKFTLLTEGCIVPENLETFRNWNSRSAKLWVMQKN